MTELRHLANRTSGNYAPQDVADSCPLFVASYTMEKHIAAALRAAGVPAHVKGYYFLKKAVCLAVDNRDIVRAVTKTLYPDVGRLFGTSASKVSSGIRYAIGIAWERGSCDAINDSAGRQPIFPERPTNAEFIITIAESIRLALDEHTVADTWAG